MTNLDEYLESEIVLEDLFKPLGNEVRIEILWTLAQTSEPVPFTTLQEEVGIEDSGNFNYHIDQLNGHFIRNTPEGYELQHPGKAIIQAIKEREIASNPEIPPRRIDIPCPFCGTDQEFSYADETLQLRCSDCSGVASEPYENGTIMSYEFPAGGLRGRTEQDVTRAAHRLYDAEVTAMVGGVCPRCSGKVEGVIELCDNHDTGKDDICEACRTRYLSWGIYTCSHCGHARQFPTWFKALYLPEVIGFFYQVTGFNRELPFPKFLSDNGADIRNITEYVRGTDPLRLVVTMNLDDAYCTVVIDEDHEVTVEEKRVK